VRQEFRELKENRMPWKKILASSLLVIGLLTGTPASAQTPTYAPTAELACKGDNVVWVNTRSGVYHYRGERYFGNTKEGKFVCEKDALREGDRPTRNGQ